MHSFLKHSAKRMFQVSWKLQWKIILLFFCGFGFSVFCHLMKYQSYWNLPAVGKPYHFLMLVAKHDFLWNIWVVDMCWIWNKSNFFVTVLQSPRKKNQNDKKIKGSQLYFTELYWVPHFLFRLTNMIWCGNDLNHTKCMFRGKCQKWQKENKQLDSALSDVTSLHWQQWLLFLLIWGQHSWASSQQCKQER